jgi:gluconate kinase
MPESLLDSQLATLEMPAEDENIVQVDGGLPRLSQVDAVLEAIGPGARPSTPPYTEVSICQAP